MAAESEEFERAWAQIVADLTADEGGGFPRLARDDDPVEQDVRQDADTSEPGPEAARESGHTEQLTPTPHAAASEAGAQRDPDPGSFVDGWSDEGHFTPPPPPDLPAGSPATRFGWVGTLGGIATFIVVTLTGWNVPRIVLWAAGLAILAGFVTLVWQLPDSRDDGWDDGAQV